MILHPWVGAIEWRCSGVRTLPLFVESSFCGMLVHRRISSKSGLLESVSTEHPLLFQYHSTKCGFVMMFKLRDVVLFMDGCGSQEPSGSPTIVDDVCSEGVVGC
ncbi:hypothetical protein Dimus_016172 [Dionaea muscipula]